MSGTVWSEVVLPAVSAGTREEGCYASSPTLAGQGHAVRIWIV